MSDDEYRVVEHDMLDYPCGLRAGDRLRLKKLLIVEDHEGQPTGERHQSGEIWKVTVGASVEPDIIWLEQPDGNLDIWSADRILEDFELVSETGTR